MCVVERDGKVVIIDQGHEIDSLVTGLENAVQAVRLSGDKINGLRLRIMELEAQVATLKKIAEEERSNFLYIYFHRSIVAKPLEPIECSNARLQDARRQLAEEHPEIFGD